MTGRAAAIQGGLAALGLVTAYLTWQRDVDLAPGAVTVLDAGKNDIGRILYDDEANTLELRREGKEIRVRLTEKPKDAAKDDKQADKKDDKDKAKPPEKKTPPPRDLLGSEAALSLYEKFTPLTSPRAFGVLEASKLKEIGLDASKRKLSVTIKGQLREFEIGQPPSSGAGESFLRDTKDGRVYLMPRGVTPELQNPGHMVDRKLHVFDTGDYDRIVVTVGDKKRELLHVGKETITTEGFASPKTPDKRDQMAKNWHDSLMRLFPQEVLGKDEVPPEGQPKIAMRIDYYNRKDLVAWLELAKTDPAAPAAAPGISEDPAAQAKDPTAGQPQVYVRSEHTVGWNKVHSGLISVLTDAEKIVAAQ